MNNLKYFKNIKIGNFKELVSTKKLFTIDKSKNILKNEVSSFIGYGPQGRSQSLNMRDQGYNAIIGVRKGPSWDKALNDGWIENKNLFNIEEACHNGTIIHYLLSDAGQSKVFPKIKNYLTKNKSLYFSHGFGMIYNKHTNINPPKDIDIFLVAPKGPGIEVRNHFINNNPINASWAVYQDFSGNATEKCLAVGFAIGCENLFKTTFEKEVFSDLTGERTVLMGLLQGAFKAQYEVLRENGHSPIEAYNETIEEGLKYLYPLVLDNGMDWMFENCSTTAQRGAIDWSENYYKVLKPEINKCYESVKSGKEAQISIESNNDINYRKNLQKELDEIKDQEMWKVQKLLKNL
jgi:ketol-acid reductoisomerase